MQYHSNMPMVGLRTYRLATASLLAVLAVGLAAAIFDHHSAEASPWHDHIYFDRGAAAHQHHGGLEPDHHNESHGDVHRSGDGGSGVVSITSTSASASYWAMVTLGLALLAYLPVMAVPGVMHRMLSHRAIKLSPISIPPPLRPPAYL